MSMVLEIRSNRSGKYTWAIVPKEGDRTNTFKVTAAAEFSRSRDARRRATSVANKLGVTLVTTE